MIRNIELDPVTRNTTVEVHQSPPAALTTDEYLVIHDGLLKIMASEQGMTVLSQQAEDLRQAMIAGHPELHSQAMEQRRVEVLGTVN